MAALWMAGWLALMLILTVAGREAHARTERVSAHGSALDTRFLMLYPLILAQRRICA